MRRDPKMFGIDDQGRSKLGRRDGDGQAQWMPLRKIRSATNKISRYGLVDFASDVYRRRVVIPIITARHRPVREFERVASYIEGKCGLEIGGPSQIFQGSSMVPIYRHVVSLDNCNFAAETVWEGHIEEGAFSVDGKIVGRQYICEAIDVGDRLANSSYDFVVSSNCLEHVANPLKAIASWLKVLKPGGLLLLVVPNKRHNFDRLRPDTSFDHMLADYTADVGEDDNHHFSEIINLTDLRVVPKRLIMDREDLARQTLNGHNNRQNHHHVFSLETTRQICAYFGLEVFLAEDVGTDFVVAARATRS
jgi:SAM-dependent methyltransferase